MEKSFGESIVAFRHHSGAEVSAGLLRLNRYVAAFEVYTPSLGLCLSDALQDFRISLGDRTIYAGRAVVTAIVNTGPLLVCEVALDEAGLRSLSLDPSTPGEKLGSFRDFLLQWQKVYRVLPEFKIATSDISTFFADLRLWLEQVELDVRALPAGNRLEVERTAVEKIAQEMTQSFNEMRDVFEGIASDLDEELRPAHQSFCRRHLHSLIMCSPFAYRTFHKPLGYAGDYEMVNMMLRDPYQGASAYAKAINYCFLSQWPAEAHRNRIIYLKQLLETESLRGARKGHPIRVLNIGCGPAHEVVKFLTESPASDYAELMLMDFNEETLDYTRTQLREIKAKHCRRTGLNFQRRSVQQLIRESARIEASKAGAPKYDLIYCAGLFDYLSDRTCKQLMDLFYEWLEPGGLVAATNVDDYKPFRNSLEFMLDWHLIYRSTGAARSLLPEAAPEEDRVVVRDPTGVNVFMEARKAAYG